jgi:Flp pilus assembly protein TadG
LSARRARHCAASRRARGQSLAELAVILPFLCALGLGVADGGRAFYYSEAVSNAARQALRVAVSPAQQVTGDAACSGTTGPAAVSLTGHIPWQSGDPTTTGFSTIANQAAVEASSDGTAGSSKIAGATLTITWHCKTNKAITGASNGGITDPNNAGSDAISVQVNYTFQLITPFVGRLFGGQSVQTSNTKTGRAEY